MVLNHIFLSFFSSIEEVISGVLFACFLKEAFKIFNSFISFNSK